MTIADKLDILGSTPHILNELIAEIPAELHKTMRIKGKWCIHEHACHLYEAQKMIYSRFEIFKNTPKPVFNPYLPEKDKNLSNHLIDMDLTSCLEKFEKDRYKLIDFLKSFTEKDWRNKGKHPEYTLYTPTIFLRHIMMHDHLHLYRIEEQWLTTDEFI